MILRIILAITVCILISVGLTHGVHALENSSFSKQEVVEDNDAIPSFYQDRSIPGLDPSLVIGIYPRENQAGVPSTTDVIFYWNSTSCSSPVPYTLYYRLDDLTSGTLPVEVAYKHHSKTFRDDYGRCLGKLTSHHFYYLLEPNHDYRFSIFGESLFNGEVFRTNFTTGPYPFDKPRAVFRNGEWIFDVNYDGIVDRRDHFGTTGDIPFTGWRDETSTYRGVFRNGEWIFDYNWDGTVDERNRFGMKGDIPLQYYDTLSDTRVRGVFRPSAYNNWIIDEGMDGTVDSRTHFGSSTDIPIMGCYSNGSSYRAVFRSGLWIWDNDMDGLIDSRIYYGSPGDLPVFGNFDNRNPMDFGVFRKGEWIIDYKQPVGVSDYRDKFGWTGDTPLYWWTDPYYIPGFYP